MRAIHRLSDRQVKNSKPGLRCDGGGLYLQTTQGTNGLTRSWLFRITGGRPERVMGLRIFPAGNLATARGYRTGENPARWRGHLKHLLPAPSRIHTVEHFPSLPYAELPEFIIELRTKPEVSARALEFTILTAARTSETTGARWSEID